MVATGSSARHEPVLALPADRLTEVALVTEGSYPCSPGGVSVWCDELMRNMPHVRFRLVAITLTDRDRWIWAPPPNVVSVEHFGVWDRVRDRLAKNRAPSCPPQLEALISLLTGPPAATLDQELAAFEPVLDGLLDLATDASLGRYLRFETFCEPVVDALSSSEHLNSRYEVTLADGLDVASSLAHLLSPLTIDPGPVDVVHATANGLPALVGLAAQARRGTPFMLTEHGLYLRERYIAAPNELGRPVLKDVMLRFHRLVVAVGLRRATLLAPASDFNARWQRAMGAEPSRVETIYNGIDPTEFPARQEPVWHTNVVWLGRVDPLKDLHTLIRSADLVRRKVPDVTYRLFGEEPPSSRGYLASCQELVRELRLEPTVTFEGRARHPADAFHAGQFSVLSSISEGFPYTVLESMSCGVPVVGTSVGGVPEAIADTGFVVPPRDPVAMADASIRMLASESRRRELGRAARERVERLFAIDAMLSRHDDLYRGWAARRTRPTELAVAQAGER